MKWKTRSVTRYRGSDLNRVVDFLSRLEPHVNRVVGSSPVFSSEEQDELLKDYRTLRERLIDGVSRQTQLVNEGFGIYKSDFVGDEVSLQVKLERTGSDLHYFVSLGLTTIEKLFLTNHLSEDLYRKYRRVLRFLPKFHSELVSRLEGSRE